MRKEQKSAQIQEGKAESGPNNIPPIHVSLCTIILFKRLTGGGGFRLCVSKWPGPNTKNRARQSCVVGGRQTQVIHGSRGGGSLRRLGLAKVLMLVKVG